MAYFIKNPNQVKFGSRFTSEIILGKEYRKIDGAWFCYYKAFNRVVFCGSGMRKIDAYRDFLSNLFSGKTVGKDHPILGV